MRLGNDARTSYVYDAASRLVGQNNAKSDNTVVSRFTYAYDNVGNRSAVAESDGSRVTWTYDDTYQLTRERRSGAVSFDVTYTYDAVGNRLAQIDSAARTTYAYDAANELLTAKNTAGRTTYTYDASGKPCPGADIGRPNDLRLGPARPLAFGGRFYRRPFHLHLQRRRPPRRSPNADRAAQVRLRFPQAAS